MSESPELHARVTKIQKDVEEIKEALRDDYFEKREVYEYRIQKVMTGCEACVTLWFEIDGIRSMMEIENYLDSIGKKIPHTTLWRAKERLLKEHLIKRVDIKNQSPIYSKILWAKLLDIDDYVRRNYQNGKS